MRRPSLKPLRLKVRSKLKALRLGLGGEGINALAWRILSEKWDPDEGNEEGSEEPQAPDGEGSFPDREGTFPQSKPARP